MGAIPGWEGGSPDEVLVAVHGWLTERPAAPDHFATIAASLARNGYDRPVIGFSYDADTSLDDWWPATDVAERNEEAGIELENTAENVLTANTVRENSSGRDQVGGIHLVNADHNTVVRNTVCDNAGPSQIVVEGSSAGNRIANNDTTC